MEDIEHSLKRQQGHEEKVVGVMSGYGEKSSECQGPKYSPNLCQLVMSSLASSRLVSHHCRRGPSINQLIFT